MRNSPEKALPVSGALKLGDLLEEFDDRLGSRPEPEVLTLTEKMGFVSQRERFNKRLAVEDTSDYKVIGLNDIAFNPYLLWANAIAQNTSWEKAIISPLYPTFHVRKGYSARFVNHLLCSGYLRARYGNIAYGSVPRKRRTTVTDFLDLTIPRQPSLSEQVRIVKLIDETDELRKLRAQADDRTATLLPALFHGMFGDAERNPMGWPTKTVEEVCDLVRGSSPRPRSDPRYYGGPIPRLMIEDVTRDGWSVTPRIDTLTELGATMSRPIKAGTIVMAVSGNIGLCAQLAVDACIHDGFVAFKNLREELFVPLFFGLAISQMREDHQRNQAGAIFQNITTTDVKDMKIPAPPLALQKEFAQRVSEIRELEANQAASRRRLDDLFQSTLHRAFNGEL